MEKLPIERGVEWTLSKTALSEGVLQGVDRLAEAFEAAQPGQRLACLYFPGNVCFSATRAQKTKALLLNIFHEEEEVAQLEVRSTSNHNVWDLADRQTIKPYEGMGIFSALLGGAERFIQDMANRRRCVQVAEMTAGQPQPFQWFKNKAKGYEVKPGQQNEANAALLLEPKTCLESGAFALRHAWAEFRGQLREMSTAEYLYPSGVLATTSTPTMEQAVRATLCKSFPPQRQDIDMSTGGVRLSLDGVLESGRQSL